MNFPTIRLMEGTGQLPISFQIKNNIKHAISSGHLPPNAQLPSVRELADQLNIAANTVARAYKELQDDGLLVTYAGKGTFVADIVTNFGLSDANRETLLGILRPAVTSARAIGYSMEQIFDGVNSLFMDHALRVGLVGINQTVVSKWKAILEREFADLGIHVTTRTISDFQDDHDDALHAFNSCFFVLSLITTYAETRALLRGQNKKIIAIITEVSMATHQALANIPHEEPVGLACEDIYINNLMGLISPYVDIAALEHASSHDAQALRTMMQNNSCILHTISLKETVAALAGPQHRLIEIEFVPNRSCFEQMRQVFLPAALAV